MKRESTLEAVAVLFGVCALLLATASISGCASFQAAGREMLPVLEAEPVEQNTSNYAEGAWLVLDGMDTYQTMRSPTMMRRTTAVSARGMLAASCGTPARSSQRGRASSLTS